MSTNPAPLPSTLYAGCDVDLRVKLYWAGADGRPVPVTHYDWLAILGRYGAEAGEMLVVTLSREQPKANE